MVSKTKSEIRKRRIIKISIICAIASLFIWFVVQNIRWNDYVEQQIQPYLNITIDPLVEGLAASEKDGLSFSVTEPSYLEFHGNLGISDEDMNLLIISIDAGKEDTYCIYLTEQEYDYPTIINSDGSLLKDGAYTLAMRETIESHRVEIDRLIKYAHEWQKAAYSNDKSYFG